MSKDDQEMLETEKNYYDWYINELNALYVKDKSKATKIAKQGLNEMGLLNQSGSNSGSLGIDKEMATIVGLCILIALCGLLIPNIAGIGMYLFGIVFFLSGVFIGLYVPVFGLIFLFSHGGAGLFIMLSAASGEFTDESITIFEKIISNPAISDGGFPTSMILYVGVALVFLVMAVIYTIIHNLSPVLKKDKKHVIRILLLLLAGIILFLLFPRIFSVFIY